MNYQAIAAIGKSKLMFWWTMVKRAVGIGAIVLGLIFYGMKGLLIGVIFNYWFSYLINISLVSKHVGYKWSRQILDLLPIAIVTSLAALISYGVGYVLDLNMYLDGLLKTGVYLIVFLGWSLIFKPEAYTYFLTAIPKKFKFWERKGKK